MTARRHTHRLATPTPATSREETPATPCVGRWDVYDALVDHKGGPEFDAGKKQAREMCGACPIMLACFRENRGEEWVKKILSDGSEARCGTESGYKKHRRRKEATCAECRRAQLEANQRRKAAKRSEVAA